MGLRFLTPLREPLQCNCSSVCGPPTQEYGLDYIAILPLLLILLWFLLYVFSCRTSFLIDSSFSSISCSGDSCDFGVPVREGELRVFLPCHLGQSSLDFSFDTFPLSRYMNLVL